MPIGIDVRLSAASASGGLLGIDFGLSTGLGRVALTAGKLQLQEHPLRCSAPGQVPSPAQYQRQGRAAYQCRRKSFVDCRKLSQHELDVDGHLVEWLGWKSRSFAPKKIGSTKPPDPAGKGG